MGKNSPLWQRNVHYFSLLEMWWENNGVLASFVRWFGSHTHLEYTRKIILAGTGRTLAHTLAAAKNTHEDVHRLLLEKYYGR